MLGLSPSPTPAVARQPGLQNAPALGFMGVPDRRPYLYLWVLAVFCTAAIAGLSRRIGAFHAATLDTDESVYIVMARRWLEGDLPYVGVYDMHPVGLPALITAGIWLLDDGLVAARLSALLAIAGTCAALFYAAARFTHTWAAGVIAATLYGIYMLRPEALVPNTELYNNLPITLAACLLFGQAERIKVGYPIQYSRTVIAAFLLGVGLQLKYVVLPEAAGFCLAFLLYWARRGGTLPEIARLAVGLMAAGLAPTLAVVAYFWSQGALQPFLYANIGSNVAYVAAVPSLDEVLSRLYVGIRPISMLIAGAAGLAVLFAFQAPLLTRSKRRVLLACALWFVLSAINVTLPMKFFAHYFYALLPPLCLVTGILIASAVGRDQMALWRAAPLPRITAWCLTIAILAAPPLRAIAREMAAPRTQLARSTELVTACIRENPSSRPGLYVFNWDPVLHETTRIPPVTPYVLPAELAEFGYSAGVDPEAEIARILASRPGYIVIATPSYLPFSPVLSSMVERAVRAYQLVCSVPMRVSKTEAGQALVYRLP